jgi:hypothetical protein
MSQVEINAQDAEFIINHPLFIKAFDMVEKGIIQEIKNADMTDTTFVSKLMLALQMLDAVQANIKGYITDAEYQAQPIQEI